MMPPLKSIQIVDKSGFGVDPATYKPFGLIGHHGVDLVAGIGTPVYAPEDGVIQVSANGTIDQYTGRNVAGQTIVLVSDKYEHWFLHLSKRLLTQGNKVKAGQLIGLTGDTGFVTGPHLHYGVRPLKPDLNNGYRGFIDPMLLLKEEDMPLTPSQQDKAIKMFKRSDPTPGELNNKDYANNFGLMIETFWNNGGKEAYEAAKKGGNKGLTPEQQKGLEALEALKNVLK